MTDERVRGRLRELAILGSVMVLVAGAGAAAAQARFDLLASDGVGGINGLTAYTIRDNRTASCYTVFVLDGEKGAGSNAARPSPPPALNPEQLRAVQRADTLREARAERDRQVVELRTRSNTLWTIDYEMARERIEQDYERSVGAVLPELYPSAQVAPGLRTTSREALDAAVGRALAEGDAAAAALAPPPVDQRLLALLERIDTTRTSRLAVSSPVRCPAVK